MEGHLTGETLESYGTGDLDPLSLLAADDHLATCDECRRQLAESPALAQAVRSAGATWHDLGREAAVEPEHLDHDTMTAFIDAKLDSVDREVAEAHLALCEGCTREVRELRSFRALLSTYPEIPVLEQERVGFVQSLRARLSEGRRGFVWSAAAGAALACAIGAVLLLPRQMTIGDELARLRQSDRQRQEDQRVASQTLSEREAQLLAAREEAERLRAQVQEKTNLKPAQLQAEMLKLAKAELEKGRKDLTASPARGLSAIDRGVRLSSAARSLPLDPANKTSAEASGQLVQTALNEVLTLPEGAELPAPYAPDQVRGSDAPAKITVQGPAGEVLATDRPTFRWQALPGASSYQLVIMKKGSGTPIPLPGSERVSGTSFKAARSLPAGVYEWQVTAKQADGTEAVGPPAEFKVLDARTLAQLEQASRTATPLELGRRYAALGLFEQAEAQSAKALKADPQSALARELLERVRGARGR